MQITDATVMMAFQVRKKETLVAFLLWWFLGTVGGHRFYCNRSGSGAAMLVTTLLSIPLCYVFCIGFIGLFAVFIWWIVDAFSIGSWIQQHNQEVMNQLEHARHRHDLAARSLPMHGARGFAARTTPAVPAVRPTRPAGTISNAIRLHVRIGDLRREITCVTGRPVSFGSDFSCQLVIVGDGVAPVHGEIERLDTGSLLVRTVDGNRLNLTCVRSGGLLSEFLVLGPGTIDRAEADPPFIIEIGPVRLEVGITA